MKIIKAKLGDVIEVHKQNACYDLAANYCKKYKSGNHQYVETKYKWCNKTYKVCECGAKK